MPEVDGTKITVTKKTSVTKLDLVPTIVDNNQRELVLANAGPVRVRAADRRRSST